MSRTQYPFPPDEFDVRGPDDAPVGVHRAPRTRWSSVWPFLLVAVLAVGLAVGGVLYLSRDPGTGDVADGTTQGPSQDDGAPADDTTADPGGEATDPASPAGEEPTDGEQGDDATPGATTDPASDVTALLQAADTGALVRVLNDGGPAGEAGRGRDALAAKGFTNLEATNYPAGGSGVTETTIWYAANRGDTAAAVAAILGVPSDHVVQQTVRSGDVVVVVKSALTPVG
ncbi:LytR C-terminal domain-containing protein [Xylanimonas allomyrinae]|uniref:LytR C-terminal domain-containing protein n=1 Tax=Xylanimonas allomyrinae TaxID=2509459 RepID=UPI0013A5F2D1|nr:LytR C-terminal domain-containing protein [Xylanimonas allomyrinae]